MVTRVLPVDPQLTLAFGPRLAMQIWRGEVTVPLLMTLGREIRSFIPECRGERYASLTVIEPGMSLQISEAARKLSETLQREFAPHIQCMAYVVDRDGFVGAMARAVATGFALVTRAPYPVKVVASVAEAGALVACHVPLAAADVQRAVEDARAAR